MKTKSLIYFVLIIVFINESCRKTEPCEALVCDECKEYVRKSSIAEMRYLGVQHRSPCFNPNNDNEFIYIKTEDNIDFYLVKYNMLTKKEDILFSKTRVRTSPKWSKNGTIVFIGWDFQIWTIRDDGTDLKRITTPMKLFSYLYPDWKNDSIITARFAVNLSVPAYYAEINLKGTFIDTIKNEIATYGTFNTLGEYVYLGEKYQIMTKKNNQYSKINEKTDFSAEFIYGLDWHPNNNDIYYSRIGKGVFCIDKNTKTEVKIRNGCSTRIFKDLSISSDGKKILVERGDITNFEEGGDYDFQDNIYIMDIDGKNERKIEF